MAFMNTNLNLRQFLAQAAAGVGPALFANYAYPGSAMNPAQRRKPNIVFVLTDQWRAQAFGYTGDPNVKTPCIDALAARSINFVNTVSVSPVCTPYRASLLTGRYPTTTGMFMNDLYLPAEELC